MAEEAAGTIAKNLPPEVCLQALSPVLREAEFPVNLAALKMIMKVQLSLIMSRSVTDFPKPQIIQKTYSSQPLRNKFKKMRCYGRFKICYDFFFFALFFVWFPKLHLLVEIFQTI